MAAKVITTSCCIAGGGPAGMMLGLLLVRAGVDVIVLEKHADFLRDFRGDTIHPSTLEIMHELGFLEEFLSLPHQPVPRLVTQFGNQAVTLADFSHLPTRAKFIAMMPQWDFLNFLASKAHFYKTFRLIMQSHATELVEDQGKIIGVKASSPDGALEIHAPLVVAADGRDSTLRTRSGLAVTDFGAPMDALWFRLSRRAGDTDQTQGRFDAGRVFVMLNRGDYWQCAFVIPKGWNELVRSAGLEVFQRDVGKLLPFAAERSQDIMDWDQVKLLTVQVNRLNTWWRDGFLCIGDAAHAMSPVGGVGINLAVQDAVAAANILAEPMRNNRLSEIHLAAVQKRREWPTKVTQRLQLTIQNSVIAPALIGKGEFKPPLVLRLIAGIPGLNRIPARLMGLGVRPEHVETREV
jgi:2-polyprenyl-6-methoxyphenol hydroxylase-like FAD-dependent oxidoreductase